MPYTMKKHGRNLEDEMRNKLGYWKLVKKQWRRMRPKPKVFFLGKIY